MRLFKTGRFHFLQPLAYMLKDNADTFKQYKSPYYIKRDLLQPFHGAVNIFNGFKNIGYGIACLKGGLIGVGITEIFRGLTRIAATPLTWFIRMPLRLVITAFTGFQKAEAGAGIQNEVRQGRAILDVLEQCNLQVSEIKSAHQSREGAIKQRNLSLGQQLTSDQERLKKEADESLSKTDEKLRNTEAELHKVQKEILPKANEVAETISRKYNKALTRGQGTALANVQPLAVVKNESNKFVTTPFINGLKLFDSDKGGKNQLSWTLNDSLRNLQPNRCAQ